MNISGQPAIPAARTYWKEKGGIGEDNVGENNGEHGNVSLEIKGQKAQNFGVKKPGWNVSITWVIVSVIYYYYLFI